MESKLSVLLYSKYSETSTKLIDKMESSGVNFQSIVSLQLLCIDNKEVRNRILQNKQINVDSVPCILVIFPDGGIEKYDGLNAFNWVEQIIEKHTPRSIPQQPINDNHIELEKRLLEQELIIKTKTKELEREKLREHNRKQFEKREESTDDSYEEPTKTKEHRRRRVKPKTRSPDKHTIGKTSIDDLPSDEDDMASDRYRKRKPVGIIREGSGNYVKDEELFPGTPPHMKKERTKSSVSIDIMSKAKELEKGRDTESVSAPPGHPANRTN